VLGDICEQPGGKRLYSHDYAEMVGHNAKAVLADEQITERKGLYGVITYLTRSRRFDSASGIGRLAALINQGKGAEALELIQSGGQKDLLWTDIPNIPPGADYRRYTPIVKIVDDALSGFSPDNGSPWYDKVFLSSDDPTHLMNRLGRFQIICATRRGPLGSVAMNAMIEEILDRRERIRASGLVYHGMPIIVTENDHPLRIYNGDAGLICNTPDGIRALFISGDEKTRSIIPLQISSWEKGYAITVHKSQGSEFDHVVIMLGDRMSRVLTRELLYTAVTRARKSVRIIGRSEHFIEACSRRTERESGLSERLWG
jgi:exodeoxyribonuclease V alpha subunit